MGIDSFAGGLAFAHWWRGGCAHFILVMSKSGEVAGGLGLRCGLGSFWLFGGGFGEDVFDAEAHGLAVKGFHLEEADLHVNELVDDGHFAVGV